jgi:hypothetical protein
MKGESEGEKWGKSAKAQMYRLNRREIEYTGNLYDKPKGEKYYE